MDPNANPTQAGASSVDDRLMAFLSTEDAPEEKPQEAPQAEEPVEEQAADGEQEEAVAEEGESEEHGEQREISVDDFAKVLGVDSETFDIDDDGNVFVKAKIDGEEVRAKFDDVLRSYQKTEHADRAMRQAAEARKQAQEQINQERETKLGELNGLNEMLKQQLLADYNAINWEELRQYDPGEYAAKRADMQQRYERINSVSQRLQFEKQKQNEESQRAMQEVLAAEAQKMSQRIEGWDNEATAEAERRAILKWGEKQLTSWGEDPKMLNTVNKAVMVDILRKAMKYDALQGNKTEVVKKVKTAPKLVRPGVTKTVKQNEITKVRDLRTNIKKSGGKEGIEEYLIRTGKV